MELKRSIEPMLMAAVKPNKVLILLGPRRVGKTRLIKRIQQTFQEPSLFLNGDDVDTHNLLETQSVANYSRLLGDCRLLLIDEAQEIPGIGKKLKLMVDSIEGLKIVVTGSSAFELNNQIGEPLVGRMQTMQLFPLAQLEFQQIENQLETYAKLEERLIFGGYPELLHLENQSQKIQYLKDLVHAYLLKDVLAFEGIKKRDKILALLQKLAFRSGSEISLEAIGKDLQISKNTVEKYLDLFKKVFVVYDVPGFSRNLDNEITKMKKWYFVDNGIRNALINNFNGLNLREDTGRLWENYLNSERRKKIAYQQLNVDSYFWRTHTQQEIDHVEVNSHSIAAFEYKWGKGLAKIPGSFAKAYSDGDFNTINRDNYLEFIL